MRSIEIGLLLWAACHPAHSQISLNAGDSYAYQFDSLPFVNHVTSGIAAPFGVFALPLFPSDLGSTGVLRFEMFEDTPAGVPIFSRTLTSSSSILDTSATVMGAWGDVQGSIRLTMLSGSAAINIFSLEAVKAASPDGFDVFGTRIVPVPEPSALGLLGVASLAAVVWHRARKAKAPSRSGCHRNLRGRGR